MITVTKTMHLLTVLSILTFSGCVAPRRLNLRNTPVPTGSPATRRNHSICFTGLADNRPDSTIGHMQNNRGGKWCDIIALNGVHGVTTWTNRELFNKLKAAGFEIYTEYVNNDELITIGGTINKIYTTTTFFSSVGEVAFQGVIRRGGDSKIIREYQGHSMSKSHADSAFRNILERSLDIACKKLVKDIIAIDGSEIPPQHTSSASATDTYTAPNISAAQCPEKKRPVSIVSGTRSVSSIKPTLDKISYRLRSLYKERLELDTTLSGPICVYFTITGEGTVENISILRNDLNDGIIEENLFEHLSQCRFTKLSGDHSATIVTYRIDFVKSIARESKNAIMALLFLVSLIPLVLSIKMLNNIPE